MKLTGRATGALWFLHCVKSGSPDPRSVSTTFSHNAPITSVDSSALVIRFPTAVGQVPSSVSRP
ncbi:hypothetical protein HMPREF9582_01593 [Cutibacterium acnes HL060PA1]|uniref:Uncharacterized protein n=1 Tax=Cutibacterium acnes TaxID=1747 RepID=A0AA44U3M6_CUTAC|nr:hypothetical protein HMPREF9582_01593 [Cutibacterium acnes HL060PA1]EFT76067.1 hypothetical protein HMPREF9599_00047 [Cutibacterium acnes HL050PA2]PEN28489.1 hypothetical protein APS59_10655 [Cutibacterium acnes]PGF26242.1 hypothetical protein B1B02_09890 [Cutibacterium acnes subsp. defendens]PGF26554.1 hypothetical protein B1B08_09870 [Cutibacterium acnes subsp. defendens]